jgi:hypothetical protein
MAKGEPPKDDAMEDDDEYDDKVEEKEEDSGDDEKEENNNDDEVDDEVDDDDHGDCDSEDDCGYSAGANASSREGNRDIHGGVPCLNVGARVAAEWIWDASKSGWGIRGLLVQLDSGGEPPEDVTLLTEALESCEPEPQSITILNSYIGEAENPDNLEDEETAAACAAFGESWERFFGDALPRLMLAVTFEGGSVAPWLLRTFALACAAPPLVLSHRTRSRLRNVILREVDFDTAQLDALATILRPGPDDDDDELGILALHFDQCTFPDGSCDVIWDRLDGSRHLRNILFTRNNLKEFGAPALKAVNSSRLRRLVVAEPDLVDVERVQLNLAMALRRNERLISVQAFGSLEGKASQSVRAAFGDLVQKYNWNLETVQLEHGRSHWAGPDCPAPARHSHLGRWLRSNVRVRIAEEHLRERGSTVTLPSFRPSKEVCRAWEGNGSVTARRRHFRSKQGDRTGSGDGKGSRSFACIVLYLYKYLVRRTQVL